MATLFVYPDAAGADDAGDRTAAQDPDTPLVTVGRAIAVMLPGDLVQVKPAISTDLGDPLDPAMQARVLDDGFGGDAIPAKDSSSSRVTIEGVSVDGVMPKWLGITASELNNWEISGFQFGYDLDSGNEYLTNQTLIYPTDLYFHDMVYTGGGANVLGFAGHNRWEDCHVTARLRDIPNPNFLEGNGFRIVTDDGNVDHVAGPDDWVEYVGCTFDHCEGEDAIQLVLANGNGSALIEDCHFGNLRQAGVAHTDAIQTTGCTTLIIRGCDFGVLGDVDSQFIASDGHVGSLTVENCLFVGSSTSGFSMQITGVIDWLIRHNTFARSRFAGLRITAQGNLPDSYGGEIYNNAIDLFQVDIPVTWTDEDQKNNLILVGPAMASDFRAAAEFGTSDDTPFDLANTPTPSPGIDQGITSDLTLDRLGRAREGAAPDCGCHESSLDRLVTPEARPPYVIAYTPPGGSVGVDRDTVVTVELFPKPGATINPATVTAETFNVTDADGFHTGGTITVGEPLENGHQIISIDPTPADGDLLFQRVQFFTNIASTIADTDGSTLADGNSVTWRTEGPDAPALGSASGVATEAFSSIVVSERTTNGCVVDFNSASLILNPVAMKQLVQMLDRLIMDTPGSETDDFAPTMEIGPLT